MYKSHLRGGKRLFASLLALSAFAWTHAAAQTVPFQGTYTGSVNNGSCSQTYQVTGHKPSQAGTKPLFLYFVGTNVSGNDGDAYKGIAPDAVTKAMAQRGYAAVSVQYDNSLNTLLSDQTNLKRCLFDQSNPNNLFAALCKPSLGVDCSKGIATWGHSLGGALALIAASYDRRVRAAWSTGTTGITNLALPKNRIRVVNGHADSTPLVGWLLGNNNDTNRLNAQTGVSSADCPFQVSQCLRPNGSGWILVQAIELSPWRNADHCWFEKSKCTDAGYRLEPNFASGTSRISLTSNLNWLVSTASTPW